MGMAAIHVIMDRIINIAKDRRKIAGGRRCLPFQITHSAIEASSSSSYRPIDMEMSNGVSQWLGVGKPFIASRLAKM